MTAVSRPKLRNRAAQLMKNTARATTPKCSGNNNLANNKDRTNPSINVMESINREILDED